MGTAWANSLSYPWEHGYYVGGIETVKVNIMLRIYANQWHVYAGLAILNPSARTQINQFSKSATELFKLMLGGDKEVLRERIYRGRDVVFGAGNPGADGEGEPELRGKKRSPIFLSEDILDRFSLARTLPTKPNDPTLPTPSHRRGKANSHLSLLAMVDCWANLGIQPLVHLDLAATPIFRMWIGVAEYLFRSPTRLDAAIEAALCDVSHRSDDLEFVIAARGWSQCVSFGNFELYRQRFMETAEFFRPRFEEAVRVGSAMIQAIMEDVREGS